MQTSNKNNCEIIPVVVPSGLCLADILTNKKTENFLSARWTCFMANKILSTIKLLFEFQYQRTEFQTSSCLSKIYIHLVFEKKHLIWSMLQCFSFGYYLLKYLSKYKDSYFFILSLDWPGLTTITEVSFQL